MGRGVGSRVGADGRRDGLRVGCDGNRVGDDEVGNLDGSSVGPLVTKLGAVVGTTDGIVEGGSVIRVG